MGTQHTRFIIQSAGLAIVLLVALVGCQSKPRKAARKAADQPTTETRIKELKLKADQVNGEVNANFEKLATMEIEIHNLEQQVASLKTDQAKRKSEISAKAEQLRAMDEKPALHDKSKLINELDVAVSTYEVMDVKIKSLQDLLAAKRETLDALQKRVANLRDMKEQLYVTIAKLETAKGLVDGKAQQSQVQDSDQLIDRLDALSKKIDNYLAERDLQGENSKKFGAGGDNGKVVPEKEAKPTKDVLDRAKKILDQDE